MRSDTDHEQEASEVAERLLRARADRYATTEHAERKIFAAVVTFLRGESRYALPLDGLREIKPLTRFCPLPLAPATVPGVVHHRGELLSVHDLGAFVRPEVKNEEPTWLLVMEQDGERMGLAADDVMDVVEVEVGSLQAVPLTLGDAAELFVGMTRDGVLIVDGARAFQVSRFALAF